VSQTERPLQFGAYALPSYHAETDGSQGQFMRKLVDLLASAEPLGFDAIWANEHHFHPWGGMMPSLPILLAALAQRTRHVTLGTSIVVLPLHNPIEIAEQMMMLDLMSNGRVQLGIGRGSHPYDYEALGVPLETAQEQMVEGLQIILKAWSGARFSHDGRFHRVEDLQVWPPGQQRPHPPVWISCSANPRSFEWTGRQGYNLLSLAFPHPVSHLAELTRIYRDAWADSGRDPAACQIGTLYHIVVAENGARARDLARGALDRFFSELRDARSMHLRPDSPPPPPGFADNLDIAAMIEGGRMLAGSPEEVADTLRYTQSEIGFTQPILMFQLGGLSFDAAHESIQLFAGEVIPRLRQRVPA